MKKRLIPFYILFLFIIECINAQNIQYSHPIKELDNATQTNYFIVGKMAENIVIAKHSPRGFYINLYNKTMGITQSVKFPELDNTVDIMEIINCKDNALLFFKKNIDDYNSIIYCIGLDSRGVPITELLKLDTIDKTYTIKLHVSDNKDYISMFIQIPAGNILKCKQTIITNDLKISSNKIFNMENIPFNRSVFFKINNKGKSYLIYKTYNQTNKNYDFQLLFSELNVPQIFFKTIDLKQLIIKEIDFEINNLSNELFIYVLFLNKISNEEKGGLFTLHFNELKGFFEENLIKFNQKNLANYSNLDLSQINIKDIILAKDNSVILFMEENKITTVVEYTNRSNYSMRGYGLGGLGLPSEFAPMSVERTMYFSGDITVLRVKQNNILASNQIIKKQENMNTDLFQSFFVLNYNQALQVYYNNSSIAGSNALNAMSIYPYGEVLKLTLNKKLNKNYQIDIKNARQIDKRTFIAPCVIKGILCFAKIEV